MRLPSSPNNTSRFEDLAPEIRNQIYRYALVADEPITLSRCINNATAQARKSGVSTSVRGANGTIYFVKANIREQVRAVGNRQFRDTKFGIGHGAGLLRVNRAIGSEARALLYACNTFTFTNTFALWEFYSLAKNAFYLLENIHFSDVKRFSISPCPLVPFTYSKRLSQFTFGLGGSLSQSNEDEAFFIIKNLLLKCGCKRCAGSDGPPSPKSDEPYCVRQAPGEQKRRLNIISIGQRYRRSVLWIGEEHDREHFKANIAHRGNEYIKASNAAHT